MVRSAYQQVGLALLLVTSFTAAECRAVTKEVTTTYPLKADGSFDLKNVNGTIRIEAWDKDVVEVRAVKTTQDKESALDQVTIDVDAKPDSLSISTRYPEEGGVEVAVDYTIHVPRHAHLNHLSTVNGTLSVTEAEGIGDLHTVNGNIEIYGGSGNVHARTTNGNVYMEWKTCRGCHRRGGGDHQWIGPAGHSREHKSQSGSALPQRQFFLGPAFPNDGRR